MNNLPSSQDLFAGFNFISFLKVSNRFLYNYFPLLFRIFFCEIHNFFVFSQLLIFINHDLLLSFLFFYQSKQIRTKSKVVNNKIIFPVYELLEARILQYTLREVFANKTFGLQHGSIGNLNYLRMLISQSF